MNQPYLIEQIRKVDEAQRRRANTALKQMVRGGVISEEDLESVACPQRGRRKSLRHLTVEDLIRMDIIRVVPSE